MEKKLSVLGVDLAKQVFHLVGMDAHGTIVVRKRLYRQLRARTCSRWEASLAKARRTKGHGCWPGTAVQPPLGLDMPHRTGYGSTDRSGDARRGQAASTASGHSGPQHREAQLVRCESIVRDRYEETDESKTGE